MEIAQNDDEIVQFHYDQQIATFAKPGDQHEIGKKHDLAENQLTLAWSLFQTKRGDLDAWSRQKEWVR